MNDAERRRRRAQEYQQRRKVRRRETELRTLAKPFLVVRDPSEMDDQQMEAWLRSGRPLVVTGT
jgi:hypothetical protein